jgi:membrane protein required for colicin V production
MNGVDIIFIVLLLFGLGLGFFQGTIRLAVSIVALYVAILLASLYFQAFGNWLRVRVNATVDTSQTVGFVIIMLVAFLLLTTAGLYTFRYARFPAGLEIMDRVVGLLLGLVLISIFLGMFALVLRNLFIFQNAGAADLPIFSWFQGETRASLLVNFFGNSILPYIYASLQPFLPRESALIFRF